MPEQTYRGTDSHHTIGLPGPTHDRIRGHQRDSETLAATVDRALDALDREAALPDAVVARLPDRDSTAATPIESNFRFPNATTDRLAAHKREGETWAGAIERALDALERADALAEAVTDAVEE
jgi:hypothetical protein